MTAEQVLPELMDHLFRHGYGRMVAGLTRVFGSDQLDLVEDVVQEAMLKAVRSWPYSGIPDAPEAWLVHVAKNLALDICRHRQMVAGKQAELEAWAERQGAVRESIDPDEIDDDLLRMIFTCCHPSMTEETRVSLTLKTVCGLGVREIARGLLAKESAVAQRLSRAKAQLQRERIAFELPAPSELPERLDTVLEVLYLVFNEGYRAHDGEQLVRRDLVEEAMRLTALLLVRPDTATPKVHALLALMCFLGARIDARVDSEGAVVRLPDQDRSLWDQEWTLFGFRHFEQSIEGAELSPYHVETAIASLHAIAPSYEETDWKSILGQYDALLSFGASPVVRLNRAVALAKVKGIAAGLLEIEGLAREAALQNYNLLEVTRAQMLWLLGRREDAIVAYRRSLEMPATVPERNMVQSRLAICEAGGPAPRI